MELNNKKRYDSLDGIRTISAFSIIFMHLYANLGIRFDNKCDAVISMLAYFVFLFMVVSGFSLCCGYYKRVINCQISPVIFYKKRVDKILPFFLVLVVLDLIVNPSIESLLEAYAEITLCYAFLPNMSFGE